MKSKLREEREKAGYSIEYVADKLNIRKQYLLALEEENYEDLPGKIYVEGYTKMYYEFLGINLQNEQNIPFQINKVPSNCEKTKLESKSNKYIIFCSVILLILVIAFYNTLILQN